MLGLSPRGAGAQRLRAGFQRQRVSDEERDRRPARQRAGLLDRKSTRLNSSHLVISYAVFCLKKKQAPAAAYPTPSDTAEFDPAQGPRSRGARRSICTLSGAPETCPGMFGATVATSVNTRCSI